MILWLEIGGFYIFFNFFRLGYKFIVVIKKEKGECNYKILVRFDDL